MPFTIGRDDFWTYAVRLGAYRDKRLFRDVNPLGETVKMRILYRPNNGMKEVHKEFIGYLRSLRREHISATIAPFSFPPLENVRRHCKARYFFLLDIHQAYQHVNLDRMLEILRGFDASLTGVRLRNMRAFLDEYCFADEGGLATGLNASPDLFNLYVGKLVDEPLWDLVRAHARRTDDTVRYTRYIDDLTLSSHKHPWGESIRWRIKHIIKEAGFTLNRAKTSPTLDIRKGPITFTGLRVQRDGLVYIPRHYLRRMRKYLRRAIDTSTFTGDHAIEKMAGMNGVFWSGTDRRRDLTGAERTIVSLWAQYRKARKNYLKAQQSP